MDQNLAQMRASVLAVLNLKGVLPQRYFFVAAVTRTHPTKPFTDRSRIIMHCLYKVHTINT